MARKPSFLQNYMINFRQIVPLFAARFSGVFTEVEAPGDESGNHLELVQEPEYQIRNGLLYGLLLMPN